ncbi:MAG: glycosyltransferase family 1 protein [Janthinobacterium lividum]
MHISLENASVRAVVCFSHLRWDFVFQRPQHLLTRMAKQMPVFFWEEPIFEDRLKPGLAEACGPDEVNVITPLLPHGLSPAEVDVMQRRLLDTYLQQHKLVRFVAWYYTPMALSFTDHLVPDATVYDCMDELSAFQGAPPELIQREQTLFAKADVVFAGGASLYESKRTQHGNVHLFPSSIDRKHFGAARKPFVDPQDQAAIPHPRIGFFGVLDERLDRDLLKDIAVAKPEWHLVLIGPVVKIRSEDLPQGNNLHYLGPKKYTELPAYLSNWDVAILPFARNASTRFISPTKTPEYLAAGKPVVSTAIRDVVRPYGDRGMVRVAEDAPAFVEAIEAALQPADVRWLAKVDEYLNLTSWDKTFQEMMAAIAEVLANRSQPATAGLAKTIRSERHV